MVAVSRVGRTGKTLVAAKRPDSVRCLRSIFAYLGLSNGPSNTPHVCRREGNSHDQKRQGRSRLRPRCKELKNLPRAQRQPQHPSIDWHLQVLQACKQTPIKGTTVLSQIFWSFCPLNFERLYFDHTIAKCPFWWHNRNLVRDILYQKLEMNFFGQRTAGLSAS